MKLKILKEEINLVKNPFKKEQVFIADYKDVEKLLKDYYGFKEYSIVAMEETPNDTVLEYQLDKKYFDKYDEEAVDEALKTKKPEQYRTATYLEGLVGSVLEPGIYIIEISW